MKHPVSLRLAAVQHYLAGEESITATAMRFNVGKTPLARWLRAYRERGIAGLEHRVSRAYTPAFKLRVVRRVISNRGDCAEASAHFGIPNETVIHRWMNSYRSGGQEALQNVKTGPKMSHKKGETTEKAASEMTVKELLEELEYLRAENAYLKKLKALRLAKAALGEPQKK